MFHQVYPRMVDLTNPIQRHIQASFERFEHQSRNGVKAGKRENKTSRIAKPVVQQQQRRKPSVHSTSLSPRKSSINSGIQNAEPGAKVDYFTADELSDDEYNGNDDDDSWWYSDAKAPESKYDEWYYLVYLPSMQTNTRSRKSSSRRRYGGMFNPSVEVDHDFDGDNKGAGFDHIDGDHDFELEFQHFHPSQDTPAAATLPCGPQEHVQITLQQELSPLAQSMHLQLETLEQQGSVYTNSSPECSPRSIELEWDDFEEPKSTHKPISSDHNHETDIQWDVEEHFHFQTEEPNEVQVVHSTQDKKEEGEGSCQLNMDKNYTEPETRIYVPQFMRNDSREMNEGFSNDEGPVISNAGQCLSKSEPLTPEQSCDSPQSSPQPFTFTPVTATRPNPAHKTEKLTEVVSESCCPFSFPLSASTPQPQPQVPTQCQHSPKAAPEPNIKSWTDLLKCEMTELTRSWSESHYSDMPWVTSKRENISFCDESQDEDGDY